MNETDTSYPIEIPLDPLGEKLSSELWAIVVDQLAPRLRQTPGWDDAFLEPEKHRALRKPLHILRYGVEDDSSSETNGAARQKGMSERVDELKSWVRTVMFPLAKAVGLYEQQARVQIASWCADSLFDRHVTVRPKLKRPRLHEAISRLREALEDPAYAKNPVGTLLRHRICPHHRAARRLSAKLASSARLDQATVEQWRSEGLLDPPPPPRSERPKESDVIDAVYTVLANDDGDDAAFINALIETGHCEPPQAERIAKERWRIAIDAAEKMWSSLMSYVEIGRLGLLQHVARYSYYAEMHLLHVWAEPIATLTPRPHETIVAIRNCIVALYHALIAVAAQLWQAKPWLEPPYSVARQRYRERITPTIREQICALFADLYHCTVAEAATIFEAMITFGFGGICDYHCGIKLSAGTTSVVFKRAVLAMHRQLSIVDVSARQEIENLLVHLQEVLAALKRPMHLFPLVDGDPYGPERDALRRRLINDDELIAQVAQRAGARAAHVRTILSGLARVGGLGVAPESTWKRMVGEDLFEYIYFFKLGRLEGRYPPWPKLLSRVNAFVKIVGRPSMSMQVLRALFFSMSMMKVPYWHGGQGDASVRQRATLSLVDVPRLHEMWVVVVVRWRLRLIDDTGRPGDYHSYALVVLDHGSGKPMGGLVCRERPTEAEFGLALYQSIWHIGDIDHPFRGIPETIALSSAYRPSEMYSLAQAAEWMLADLTWYTDERHWQQLPVIREIREQTADHIKMTLRPHEMTPVRVQALLLSWLHGKYLGNQRPEEIPLRYRRLGVVMPGHRTPVAGWLLPQAETTVRTVLGGIIKDGRFYTRKGFSPPPGEVLPYRAAPPGYGSNDSGIFVEYRQNLYYVRPARS